MDPFNQLKKWDDATYKGRNICNHSIDPTEEGKETKWHFKYPSTENKHLYQH